MGVDGRGKRGGRAPVDLCAVSGESRADVAGRARGNVHALPAGPPRRRSDGGGHRVRCVGGLRPGREPAAHAEGTAVDAARVLNPTQRGVRAPQSGYNSPAVKPWLSHYDADVRPSVAPYPDKTLIDYLDQ